MSTSDNKEYTECPHGQIVHFSASYKERSSTDPQAHDFSLRQISRETFDQTKVRVSPNSRTSLACYRPDTPGDLHVVGIYLRVDNYLVIIRRARGVRYTPPN